MSDLLTIRQAAAELGVSRRRAQAMIDAGLLPAERIGPSWLIHDHDVRCLRHVQAAGHGGRPISATRAWQEIAAGPPSFDHEALDRFRRRVRPRADHRNVFVHPSRLRDLVDEPKVVLSGRHAAEEHALPTGDDNAVDVYLRHSDLPWFADAYRPIAGEPMPDTYLHVVDDAAWAFPNGARYVSLLVAWLDLEDRQDRAARLVLESLQREMVGHDQ